MHDVERAEDGIGACKRCGNDGKILGKVVGDAERRQRATRHQHLFADFHNLQQLRGVRIEIDHVARFFGGLRA